MAEAGSQTTTAQRIYDAAVALFAEQGFDRTGVREVARTAGVNLAAINYCYGSKAGLLSDILAAFFYGYKDAALASYDPQLALPDQLYALARSVSGFVSANPQLARIAVSQLAVDSPDTAAVKASYVETLGRDMRERLLRPMIGPTADTVPVTIIGPALMALATSGELFRPVTERLSQELRAPAEGVDYERVIAAIAAYGMPGGLAEIDGRAGPPGDGRDHPDPAEPS